MKNITDIMKFLGVDEEMAEKVLSEMENSGLDFSECTMKEFKMAMQEAYIEISKVSTTGEKVEKLWKLLEPVMITLFERWMDEQEYEDIKDYAQPIRKIVEENKAKIKKMTRQPFGFRLSIEGQEYQISVTRKSYSYNRTK